MFVYFYSNYGAPSFTWKERDGQFMFMTVNVQMYV